MILQISRKNPLQPGSVQVLFSDPGDIPDLHVTKSWSTVCVLNIEQQCCGAGVEAENK